MRYASSFCCCPFIICQCQSRSQSVSFCSSSCRKVLPLRLRHCLRFVKMEMKKICTVAAFVAFFQRGRLGVRMSFLIIFVGLLCECQCVCVCVFFFALHCFWCIAARSLLFVSRLSFVLHFYAYFKKVLFESCTSPAQVLLSFVACNHLKCDNFLHNN